MFLRISTELSSTNPGDPFDPRSVVCHPHVNTGHVGVGAADAVGHCSAQCPPTVLSLEHQRSSTITLKLLIYKILAPYDLLIAVPETTTR